MLERKERIVFLTPAILIGLYLLFTATTDPLPLNSLYDSKRLLQLILLFVLFSLCLIYQPLRLAFTEQLQASPAWLRLGLCAVFALGTISALLNFQSVAQLSTSLAEWALLAVLVLAVFLVAAARRKSGQLYDLCALGLLALMAIAVGIQELVGAVGVLSTGNSPGFDTMLSYWSHPRFYNQVESWLVPALAATPLLFSRYRLLQALSWLALGFLWYILLATAARGSLVGITTALIVCALLIPGARKRMLLSQLVGLLLAIGIFAAVQTVSSQASSQAIVLDSYQVAQIENAEEGLISSYEKSVGRGVRSSSSRLTWLWPRALNVAQENWLIGIGPNNFSCTHFIGVSHPHNVVLQLLAELGLVTTLLIATLVIALLILGITRVRDEPRANSFVPAALMTGVIAACIHAVFSGVFIMPASQLAGVLIGGMLVGSVKSAAATRQPVRESALIPVICVLLLSGLLAYSYKQLNTMEARQMMLPAEKIGLPRMWGDGQVCNIQAIPDGS